MSRRIDLIFLCVLCTHSVPVFAQESAPIVKDTVNEAPPKTKDVWAQRKTEALLETAMTGGSSSWVGDPTVMSEMRLGFRFMETGALYVQGGIGYAPVNQRELVQIGFGGKMWLHIWHVRPYARLGVMHQHEESTAAWKTDFAESLFGVGDGIRHRAGAEAALGLDVPFFRGDKVEVVGSAEFSTPWFPDDRGPHFYLMGGLGLGIHYAL